MALVPGRAGSVPLCPPAVVWSAGHNGPANGTDLVARVATDPSGNVIVAGHETTGTGLDWRVQKFNSAGVSQWVSTFNGPANGTDEVYDVGTDPVGAVFVTGSTSVAGQSYNWQTIKYSPTGSTLWVSTYNGAISGDDRAYGLAVDPGGNVIATGFETTSAQGQNLLTIKYDGTTGATLWSASYNCPANTNEYACDAAADSAGNVIVAGTENRTDLGQGGNLLVVKYSASGTPLWQKSVDGGTGGGWDEAWSVAVDGTDNVIVAGQLTQAVGGSNAVVLKYDSGGTLLWSRTYNNASNSTDVAYAVAADVSGNIVAGGREVRSDLGEGDNWILLQYAATGALLCTSAYDGAMNSNDFIRGVALDSSGSLYAAGTETVAGQGNNWLVIKYGSSAPAGGSTPPNVPPESESKDAVKIVGGIRGYLDPKKGEQATILVRPDRAGEITVRIYNLNGELVRILSATAGGGHTEVLRWDATDSSGIPVPPGTYPILIEAPGIRYRDTLAVLR